MSCEFYWSENIKKYFILIEIDTITKIGFPDVWYIWQLGYPIRCPKLVIVKFWVSFIYKEKCNLQKTTVNHRNIFTD